MILKKPIMLLIIALVFLQSCANKQQSIDRPKLVVGIVVDQMRWDYLYRYYDRYSNDGFIRLLNEGYTFEDCKINYIPSYTAIGHATIYTGSIPNIHGMTGNSFFDKKTGEKIYCVQDNDVNSIGCKSPDEKTGKMSPKNLLATTVGDQLRLATNFNAKVIGISLKDRGSILSAGHTANAAYWFDGKTGNWVTSSWYTTELPAWLVEYNAKEMPKRYLSQDWHPLFPIETYLQSTPDNNNYEQGYVKDINPIFPIKTSELMKNQGLELIKGTPFGNTITFEMAKLAIEHEELGKDNITDLLTISLSSPDYIGHQFGPNSPKIEDNYLRLDRELSDFFKFLDGKVGPGNYTVFLTADHGATLNAQYMIDHKLHGDAWDSRKYTKKLNRDLENKFGIKNAILAIENSQVNFNYNNIPSTININEIKEESIRILEEIDGVSSVIEMNNIASAMITSTIKEKIINGYNRKRSGDIQIILETGWYDASGRKGATHGTWNPDDTHIPLVWMGWGIEHGRCTNREVYMTDIAPTIAALLRIQMPNGCIGKSLF